MPFNIHASDLKRHARIALVNVVLLVGMLLSAEIATRLVISLKWKEPAFLWYAIKYDALEYSHVGPNFYTDHGSYLAFHPKVHKSVEWADGDVLINEYGFRGKSFSSIKEDGVLRIVAMGDSATFGFHVGDDQVWPRRLELKLQEAGWRAEVINLGLPWYNTESNLKLLEFALTLSPDMVIYVGGATDVVDLGMPRLQSHKVPLAHLLAKSVERYSLLAAKLRILVEPPPTLSPEEQKQAIERAVSERVSSNDLEDARSLVVEPILSNLQVMRKRVEDTGARFVVATQLRAPVGWDWIAKTKANGTFASAIRAYEYKMRRHDFTAYHAEVMSKLESQGGVTSVDATQFVFGLYIEGLRQFAQTQGMTLVDFVVQSSGSFALLTSDLHMTVRGHEQFADALISGLKF
jgi:lysophospholipase L1-like esterase